MALTPSTPASTQFQTLLLICTFLFVGLGSSSFKLPLTYAINPYNDHKYPITLSFNQSDTSTPYVSNGVYLYDFNITMETTYRPGDTEVVIGLKNPSSFLGAVQAIFQVNPHQIEFGKDQFLELLIKDNNFVESKDYFVNGEEYWAEVRYNFGSQLVKDSQICYLASGEQVLFDEFLILQVLNTMDPRNKISYTQNPIDHTISIIGELRNFPKIIFVRGKSQFEVQISHNIISYIPRGESSQSISIIGYQSLDKFGKFSIMENDIIFKRTSQLYQLYLFLAYFVAFTLVFLILFRRNFTDSMKFVTNVVSWVIFQNPEARIRVLRTELQ